MNTLFKYSIFFVMLSLLLICCKSDFKSVKSEKVFNILISYPRNSDLKREEIRDDKFYSKDSIHLFVEANFDDDLLSIYLNEELFVEEKVTTEALLPVAKYYNLGSRRQIGQLGLRINHGQLVYVDCLPTNIITLNRQLDTIKVNFKNKANIYY